MSKHDKNKGGLLETWFGIGPKTRTKPQNATSRPSSVEGDVVELENAIKSLNEQETNLRFIEILEDMNIPKDKRAPLLLKPKIEKQDMIFMHLKGKNSLEHRSNSKFEKPTDYIDYLQSGDHSEHKILQCVESLRVALTSNPISWIKEFGENGIDEIVTLLRKCKLERHYDKIEFECLRCLKAILNNSWGLNLVLKPDQHSVVLLLAQSLNPRKPHIMCEALKLLAGFCLLPERKGYEKVLRAITNIPNSIYKSGERFKPIVDGLFVDEKFDPRRELCYNCLLFINTITNTPVDLNFRLHLRCEIMRMGLYERLDTLTEIVQISSNENLKKHFKIFNEIREDDFEEFFQRFDNVRFELDDVSDCFEVLKNLIFETPAEPLFLSILQHLLYIRDDFYYRPAYYQLIEECVSQIVFHKGYCDPIFDNRNFNIDIAFLLDDTVEKSKAREMKRSEEFEKKIEMLEIAKQEAEARASHLEDQLKKFSDGTININQIKPICPPPPTPPPPMPGGTSVFRPPPPPPIPGMGPPPPPPPPPMMGGPRPPPPPPGMGPMPPPPPPGMMRATPMAQNTVLPTWLKPKKKWNTKNPTKRINWKTIIPNKLNEKSFWINCQEEKLASDDFLNELSIKFNSKPVKLENKDSVDKSTTRKNVVEMKVLDGKTAQNMLILLGGSLKHMSFTQIKTFLLKCDTTALTQNILQQLIQYLPPPDQVKKLQEIKSKGEELSSVEDFIATIGEIKRLSQRLHSLNFKLTVPDTIQDIKPDIAAGTAACEEVKTSKKFAKILELILLLGNYMNTGSKNEQAFGFEFSFLSKLSNTKDTENKKNILHYLSDIAEKKFPETLTFYDDLSHVDRACRVSVETIQKSLRSMNTSLKSLETDLNNNKSKQSEDDCFNEVMGAFAIECRQQIDVLGKMQIQMEKLYKDLADYYSFDPLKYNMEEFFGDIKSFKYAFIQSYQDNVKEREAELKAKRMLEAKEQQLKNSLERQQRRALVDMDSVQNQEGVMDSLLEALQTGSAFGSRQKRRPRPAGAERRAQLGRTKNKINSQLATREMISNERTLILP